MNLSARIDTAPASLYLSPARADADAAKLQASEEDGWLYTAVHPTDGLSYIEVRDDAGHLIGRI